MSQDNEPGQPDRSGPAEKGIIMNDIHGLAQELLAIESETFEIDDYAGGEMDINVTVSTTSSTTSSSCA
jgi:hypothetical protein